MNPNINSEIQITLPRATPAINNLYEVVDGAMNI